jgi:hypothetical protein
MTQLSWSLLEAGFVSMRWCGDKEDGMLSTEDSEMSEAVVRGQVGTDH